MSANGGRPRTRRTPSNGKVKPIKSPQLDPRELAEFRLRRATFDQARCAYLMVEESYRVWLRGVRDKYGMTAKYDIDVETGVLTAQTDG